TRPTTGRNGNKNSVSSHTVNNGQCNNLSNSKNQNENPSSKNGCSVVGMMFQSVKLKHEQLFRHEIGLTLPIKLHTGQPRKSRVIPPSDNLNMNMNININKSS